MAKGPEQTFLTTRSGLFFSIRLQWRLLQHCLSVLEKTVLWWPTIGIQQCSQCYSRSANVCLQTELLP